MKFIEKSKGEKLLRLLEPTAMVDYVLGVHIIGYIPIKIRYNQVTVIQINYFIIITIQIDLCLFFFQAAGEENRTQQCNTMRPTATTNGKGEF